jgi:hypothetical protein
MIASIRTFPTSPTDEQLANLLKEYSYARIDNWLDTDFCTASWWFLIVLFIIMVLIWWKLVDKKRLIELSFYGCLIMTISIWFDQVGYELGLWYYPVDLIPVFPPSTAIDYVMIPVIYSLIYQYCTTWRTFIMATVLMSGIFSFILEPLLTKFGFYILVKWKYYYGFPIYIALALILRFIIEKMKSRQNR